MRRTWPGLGLLLCTTLALGVGAAACRGDDDSGDDDAGPRPDGSGNDNTIYSIQMGMIPPGSSVRLEGVVVTAIDTFGGRVGGVYVQEPMGGPYSGVLVYNAMVPAGLVPGDVVTVAGGQTTEFALSTDTSGRTLTEIEPPMGGMVTITRTGTGMLPAPVVVDSVALADAIRMQGMTGEPMEVEQWEGVLIKLENVAAVSSPRGVSMSDMTLKEMNVTGPFAVNSALASLDGEMEGDCYVSITGVGDYFFSYKVLPRSAADLVAGGTMCPPAEDTMALCMNTTDDDHDGFADCMDRSCQTLPMCIVDTSIVDIQNGTVAEGTRVRLADKIVTAVAASLVWIQDAAQGAPNNGVVVFPMTMPMGLAVGDHVDVEGSVTEYYDATEVEFATITKLVTAPTTPVPAVIANPLDLVAAATAEPYEGVLVTVSNVKVLAAPAAPGNEWIVGPSGTMTAMGLHVDDTMLKTGTGMGQINPTVGTCYMSITGPLDYSFMSYKIEPRSLADAVQPGGTCP